MTGTYSRVAIVSVGLAIGCLGCGSSAPKTVRVSGVVDFDGKPLTKGTITFLPQTTGEKDLNRPATGIIDSQGRFELSTYKPGDGALPGKYQVTVVSNSVEPTLEEIAEGAKYVSAIPAGYNSPLTSGLSATVSESGPVTLDFHLKTGGAPDKAPDQTPNPQGQTTDQFGT